MHMINNIDSAANRNRLNPSVSVLYEPSAADWSYSHHPSLCFFKGRLWAAWSNGKTDEDDLGQRVLYAVSHDGLQWSNPQILFDSFPDKVLTAAGMYAQNDKLTAYAGSYAYAEDNIKNGHYIDIGVMHTDTSLLCRMSEDGALWSDITDTHIPVVPNQGPVRIRSGRLIMCGNVTFPFSDCPDGARGWTVSGLDPCVWPGMYDDAEGFQIHKKLRPDNTFLCEGSFFQTDDDILHMLLRSDKGILYYSESSDDANSWSAPKATAFSDCGSKFHCGHLGDGRFYIIGNPDPGPRCSLILSVSEDGVNFNRSYVICDVFRPLRVPGLYKGGIYGYPHSVLSDENLHVICSVNKEDIYVFTIPLKQIT